MSDFLRFSFAFFFFIALSFLQVNASNNFYRSNKLNYSALINSYVINVEPVDSTVLPVGFIENIDPRKLSKMDVKFGVGHGFFDPRDNSLFKFETDVSHKWNRFITNSLSMNYGVKYRGLSESLSIFHADMNILYSPFRNDRRHNLKVGVGVSYLYADETAFVSSRFENGQLIEEYDFNKEWMIGNHFILEHEISVGERYLVGFKVVTYSYSKGSQTAASVKFGVRL